MVAACVAGRSGEGRCRHANPQLDHSPLAKHEPPKRERVEHLVSENDPLYRRVGQSVQPHHALP